MVRRLLYTLLILSATFQLCMAAASYNTSPDSQLYQSYINQNMAQWEQIIQQYATTLSGEKLLNIYYGYTAWLLSVDDHDQAETYIEKSEQLIGKLLKQNPKNATAYAFRGAFLGYAIGNAPYKAISLGPKSNEAIARALKLEPNNIQALIEQGNAAYYTPTLFGGSKETSVRAYTKAIQLMETGGLTQNNWLYLNVLTLLAQAQQRTHRMEEADITYKKILSIEPNFKWVKEQLYPEFKKIHDNFADKKIIAIGILNTNRRRDFFNKWIKILGYNNSLFSLDSKKSLYLWQIKTT